MTPTHNGFSASVRAALARRFNAKMDEIRLHCDIARDLFAQGAKSVTRAEIVTEHLTRRIQAAQDYLARPPRRPGDTRDDLRDGATRDRDLGRRIDEQMAFISQPRRKPDAGVDLSAALWRGGVEAREAADPERWRVAIHESAHGVVANAMSPGGVEVVRVARDGRSGECRFTNRLPDLDDATVSAAGREAEFIFGLATNTRLQDHDPSCDGPQFLKALAAHHGAPVDDLDPLACAASERARWFIEHNINAIVGCAKLLFDFGTITGADVRAVAEFHAGVYDGILRERGIHRT